MSKSSSTRLGGHYSNDRRGTGTEPLQQAGLGVPPPLTNSLHFHLDSSWHNL